MDVKTTQSTPRFRGHTHVMILPRTGEPLGLLFFPNWVGEEWEERIVIRPLFTKTDDASQADTASK